MDLIYLVTIGYRCSFVIGLLSLFIAKLYLPVFLQYGKTITKNNKGESNDSNVNKVLFKIEHFTVPKSYFSHFYIISTILSIAVLKDYPKYPISWLLLVHSLRRLYETIYVSKYSKNSRMNWSHYIVGIWFYSVLHLIVRIKLHQGKISKDINIVSLVIFIIASWDQYKNHRVLSELVKYSLPTKRLFKICCSPHYFDEILIYSSFVSYNNEFIWLLIWVIASLSISAIETKAYYKDKFRHQFVPNHAIIPFIL
ncbi:hypothetical protein Kpol_1009p22 [Vanderwaltozyma polyspora DSM 70294]|uniref:Polyprenal reductase n=1 Tax=Vanderwaltozyma polyspora (strain ATCC 22028 / DSM 70294 / BCRC 21397 / CBS 2163 / NBRC 10782 / NRRL Y-8283 / UCD 57-17) TaxID=436907 RepID=A7TPE7_VANPO|nr:uncharacterized protein Kpol_1009p22 [Vanderwaltozyma polyspora DSM 70294]EDO15875.1 hypothetical protein Kpol_1009p22 [Vanderwaltozyma polyspora DSM 70294]